ncbi:protein of unknown function [Draconibacterium orientale]|uniref:DUF5020 domain-containing protein n=1 Tax=Draconibacterium orientale TaxID=1168034 RepID=X5DGT6_9BACT|nr:DUF5020 family protein [Draconibacterium orientale]AHW59667.1 hypothetical protein FH5T_08875 [Draconibacterium orientale]SES80051.1 protein of unknown function [Draconibacterium orientale]
MKKVLLAIAFVAFVFGVNAQNVQLHYDFGDGRKMLTSTVEMFRPDAYGSTFFFIDMDYGADGTGIDNGISLAYWEIARAFKWNETQKFMPRVEYNGGTMSVAPEAWIPIENCWLAGVERTWASADFSKILTLQANYKNIKNKLENGTKNQNSFQLTAVWTVQMAEGKFTFTGFADFWKEEMYWGTDYRFLTEPQLWYNPCKNFSFGTEIELSNNFVGDEFAVKPTLAVKYTF